MNLPPEAFVRNRPGLPHFRDERREVGRFQTGGREDGTGYAAQTIQYPVICAEDIVERSPNAGKDADWVTDDPKRVRCADCKERLNALA